MKDKTLSPDLDKIEFLPDADERMKRAIEASVRQHPTRQTKRTIHNPPAKKAKRKPR